MMSPGWILLIGTRARWCHILFAVRGRCTPACAQDATTRPEQSNPRGPVPPHRYGDPILVMAYATARAPAGTATLGATGATLGTDSALGTLGAARRGAGPPLVRPARTEQTGHAPGPWLASTFSAMAICCALVARFACEA